MGGKIVRTIGIVRARFKIGMLNLGYNIRRLGPAQADGSCARLSALTGGVGVASCKGPRKSPAKLRESLGQLRVERGPAIVEPDVAALRPPKFLEGASKNSVFDRSV
jgi:hypothetical protein